MFQIQRMARHGLWLNVGMILGGLVLSSAMVRGFPLPASRSLQPARTCLQTTTAPATYYPNKSLPAGARCPAMQAR